MKSQDIFVPCMFDTLDKFLYYPVAKVCIHSIAHCLLKRRAIILRRNPAVWVQKYLAFYSIDDQSMSDSLFRFAFVRNPYDRAVSAFLYLQRKRKISKQWDFDSFIIHHKDKGNRLNPHFNLQTLGFDLDDLDFLGRFENIDQDWKYVANQIDASEKLPRANATNRDSKLADYYSTDSQKVVMDMYEQDFDLLKYSRGLPK